MQSENADIFHGVKLSQGRVDLGIGDTEFALRLSGRNVAVGMRTDVWVDSQGDVHPFPLFGRQLVDYFQFLQGFTVESENTLTDGVFDLVVAFPDSCKDDLCGMESVFYCTFHLIAAHTIRS